MSDPQTTESHTFWDAQNNCLGQPRDKKISLSILNWRPNFKIGDIVKRRLPTHDKNGDVSLGKVKSFHWVGDHLIAEVAFNYGTENFAASTYERAYQ